jgi:hypothetical protein
MQLNEGMFVGTDGWVIKPPRLLGMSEIMPGRHKLAAEIIGISVRTSARPPSPERMLTRRSSAPPPNGRAEKSYSAYLTAELFHAQQDQKWRSKTVKTQDGHNLGADIMWNENFEWEYEADDLAFLRYAFSPPVSLAYVFTGTQTHCDGERIRAGRQDGGVLCARGPFAAGALSPYGSCMTADARLLGLAAGADARHEGEEFGRDAARAVHSFARQLGVQ